MFGKQRCVGFVLVVIAVLGLAGCVVPVAPTTQPGRMMGGQGGVQPAQPNAGTFSSAGEEIWLTGVGVSGQPIQRTAPRTSQGALMMGGGGCASCHGPNGQGGTIQMMMGPAIKAPNVTYDALVKEGYTSATIGRAITKGLDEVGKPLDEAMPRWAMNSADLEATIAYLKVLSTP